jgi:hypothetical protein
MDEEVTVIELAGFDPVGEPEIRVMQQARSLTLAERGDLSALMHLYQEGLRRKARGLRQAVERGLLEPLQS